MEIAPIHETQFYKDVVAEVERRHGDTGVVNTSFFSMFLHTIREMVTAEDQRKVWAYEVKGIDPQIRRGSNFRSIDG